MMEAFQALKEYVSDLLSKASIGNLIIICFIIGAFLIISLFGTKKFSGYFETRGVKLGLKVEPQDSQTSTTINHTTDNNSTAASNKKNKNYFDYFFKFLTYIITTILILSIVFLIALVITSSSSSGNTDQSPASTSISKPETPPMSSSIEKSTEILPTVSSSTTFWAKASSTDVNLYNHEYEIGPDMAVDGLLATAWNEGAGGYGVGEWIKLTPSDGRTYLYNGFCIANGFQHHTYHKGDRWTKNCRVASLKVYTDDSSLIGEFPIADRYDGYETITFSQPIQSCSLTFEITDVWTDAETQDTCISEIRPF